MAATPTRVDLALTFEQAKELERILRSEAAARIASPALLAELRKAATDAVEQAIIATVFES